MKNPKKQGLSMTDQAIKAIETILAEGDRAEVFPGPNGTVKVLHIKKTLVADTSKH